MAQLEQQEGQLQPSIEGQACHAKSTWAKGTESCMLGPRAACCSAQHSFSNADSVVSKRCGVAAALSTPPDGTPPGTTTLLSGQTPEPRMHQAESQSQVGSSDDRGAALTPARNLGCTKNCASSAPGTAKAVAMARRTILVVVPLPSSLPLLSLSLLSSMVGACARGGFVVTWQAACWASEGATSAV